MVTGSDKSKRELTLCCQCPAGNAVRDILQTRIEIKHLRWRGLVLLALA